MARARIVLLVAAVVWLLVSVPVSAQTVTKYVRFAEGSRVAYGVLEGDTIAELAGGLFDNPKPTGRRVKLADVKLLAPVAPSKVIAVGLNYQTHLGERSSAKYPGLFAKLPTTIIGPGDAIVFPPDATNVHYEGEMVVVIGRRASHVSEAEAPDYVFGVTCGNDVSERDWQKSDLQWFRAKATDTFGPLGPVIARGLNYNDLLLQTRLNGEVKQKQRTSDLIFSVPAVVSYISRYVTLLPGDIIYTGTPGATSAMKPGDVVEVELEGVGVLRNTVKR